MTRMLVGLLTVAGIGVVGYAWHDASVEDPRVAHCAVVKQLVLDEAETLLARGLFPSRDTQDRWQQLARACEPESKA